MSNRKRITFLVIICLFTLAAASTYLPANWRAALTFAQTPQPPKQSPRQSKADREKLAKKPAPSGTMQERLSDDDGYGLVVFYSSSVHGNLEVCGCPIHPMGGVARRAGYINAFRKRSPDAAVLQVDAGYIFSDDRNTAGTDLRDDARLMNDWLVRGNEALGLDIVNLSYRDLRYASSLLRKDTALKPEKSTLISANVKATDDTRLNPAPYVIKLATSKRLPQPVRIAFIGLTDFAPENQKDAVAASGFKIEDPLAAAKTALAEVRDRADVTVIVGFLSMPTVNKLARQNDDLDIIINTDERGIVFDPKQVNNTLIVYAAKETKHLGELRFYTDAEGVVDRFTARYVELDEVIPDDPALLAITKQARQEIDVVQTRMAEAEADAYAAKLAAAGPQESSFVTSAKCAECHKTEYEIWQKSRHAHAFPALEEKHRQFDAACVGCHSLGFQQGGFVNIKATPQFANVHCESCHGAGAEHVKMPTAGNYQTPSKNQSCLVCHDRENSPDFDFAKYWPVVAHKNSLKPVPAAPTKAPMGRRVRKK
jgi:2',3'-cyclic-nucleotide 2'-phosphodiesterase (5'-nucleotidase family)